MNGSSMASNELQSRLFFLDTETYVARNFGFESGALSNLLKHLSDDDCRLLITDINVREIRRHLRRKSLEAVSILKATAKDAMVLRNTPNIQWHAIFSKVSSDEIFEQLSQQFDRFLANDNVEQLSTAGVDVAEIFDAYFEERPPFASSGKKSEFPDAFILSAINNISRERGIPLYVVSNDGDVKSFCAAYENLISIARLEELLGLIVANSERLAEPSKVAEAAYVDLEDQIHKAIRAELETIDFAFRVVDINEAEISSLAIEDVEYLSKTLTDASEECANFEVIVRFSIAVELAFPDFERSPWDSEDKEYPFLFYNYETRRYLHTGPVEVQVIFPDRLPANAEIEWIDIEALSDLKQAKYEILGVREEYFDDEN